MREALEELYAIHNNSRQRRDQRTPLVLTFDDGYHDNYTYAFVLARQFQVPFTIFLVPSYIESGSKLWWQEGDQLVLNAKARETTIEGRTYHLENLGERKALAQAVFARIFHATSVSEREEFLVATGEALASSTVVAEEKVMATSPLTWAEVREMEESGWVSFGAHTMHHPILAYLTNPAEAQYEVTECRMVLEQQLGHQVRAFAYPVGKPEHIGEKGLCAVQQAKYTWALTTIHGFNTPTTDPHLLHRIVVDVDQHWLSVAAKGSGVWDFFSHLYWLLRNAVRKLL